MTIDRSATGRAWTWHQPGDPIDLRLAQGNWSTPGAGDVVVANRAAGLNPVDWKLIAQPPAEWRPGHVPGVDGAGIVVAVGEGVSVRPGTRVAYHQAIGRDGSFADTACVAARALLSIPDALDDVAAAALPCPGLTAWQAAAKVPDGHGRDVLVTCW